MQLQSEKKAEEEKEVEAEKATGESLDRATQTAFNKHLVVAGSCNYIFYVEKKVTKGAMTKFEFFETREVTRSILRSQMCSPLNNHACFPKGDHFGLSCWVSSACGHGRSCPFMSRIKPQSLKQYVIY